MLAGERSFRSDDVRTSLTKPFAVLLLGIIVSGLSVNPLYGLAVVACVGAAMIAIWPLSSLTVAVTTTLLIILPDSPNLFSVYHLQMTPRLLALVLILAQCAVNVLRGRQARLTFGMVWLVYILAVAIGAVLVGRLQAVPLFLFMALAPYWVGCIFGADAELLDGVLRGIVSGVCILAAIAITEFILHRNFLAPVYNVVGGEYSRVGNVRANAGWIHPLALGMFLCLGGFVAIDRMQRRGPVFAVLTVMLIAGGIFATQERSPLIGLIMGAVVFVVLQFNTIMRVRAVVLVGILVVALFSIPGQSGAAFRQFISQSTATGSAAGADVTGRLNLLHLGIHAVSTRPFFGFGYGTSTSVLQNPLLAPLLMGHNTTYADIANWPLAIAIETGLLGLAAFVVLVVGNMVRMIKYRSTAYPLSIVAASAGIVAAFVTSIGVSAVPTSMLFVFFVGLCSTGCRIGSMQSQM